MTSELDVAMCALDRIGVRIDELRVVVADLKVLLAILSMDRVKCDMRLLVESDVVVA